jgi:hypothetical protein
VAIGVFAVGRLARQTDKDADHNAVGHIRGRVDAVGQQGRTVADHADHGLERRQQNIGRQSHLDRQHACVAPPFDSERIRLFFHSAFPASGSLLFFSLC